MSLTSMLADTGSSVRCFLDVELPAVAAVRADHRARWPAGVVVRCPAPPDGIRPAWGTLGAAIDHRIRLALSDSLRPGGAVVNGVELVAAPQMDRPGPVRAALRAAGRDLLAEFEHAVSTLRPSDPRSLLAPGDEERLARLCVVAAWFEEVYRSGRLWVGTPVGDGGTDITLDLLLAAVPAYAVQDVVAVSATAAVALAGVRASCAPPDVHVGPVFAGSRAVGGADADWIAAGLLVDVKATVAPEKALRADVHQLAAYALLDHDDRYGIERVGWYLARAGVLVTWELPAFVGLLGAARPVADLRRRLANILAAP